MSTNIYFAISQSMIDRNGLPETHTSGVFNWELTSDSFYASVIADSMGKVLDYVKPYAKEPFAICKANVSNEDVALAFATCLNGDRAKFQVKILELTWIK
jgi:hypothetical protein